MDRSQTNHTTPPDRYFAQGCCVYERDGDAIFLLVETRGATHAKLTASALNQDERRARAEQDALNVKVEGWLRNWKEAA